MYLDGARCDIHEVIYPQPDRPGWCELGYGQSFGLALLPYVECAWHTVFGTSLISRSHTTWFAAARAKPLRDGRDLHAVLPYGWTLRKGSLSCTSKTTGVTCTDLTTKHGFRLSRAAYTMF